ncbi:MAG: hypothetical protein ACRD97_09525 [Nitrososphaeraceae archaeon]
MDYFFSFILQISIYDLMEGMIYVAGGVFSILLLGLSISAYRNSGLKKLLYAISVFALFSIFLFYEYIEHTYRFDTPITDLVFPSMALAILVLFFLAVVKKS